SGLDLRTRTITLDRSVVGKAASYAVNVRPDAVCRRFPNDATRLKDAVAGSLDGIAAGDTVYVRGKKTSAQHFAATLVVSGGFRSFAATIESMDVFDEELHVHTVLSGTARTVHL